MVNTHARPAVFALLAFSFARAKTPHVDANFFEKREKKVRFQTKTDTCGRGLSKREAVVDKNVVFSSHW